MFDSEKLRIVKDIFNQINNDFEDLSDINENDLESSFEEHFKQEELQLKNHQRQIQKNKMEEKIQVLNKDNILLKEKLNKHEKKQINSSMENKLFLKLIQDVSESSSITNAVNFVLKFSRSEQSTSNSTLVENFKSFLVKIQQEIYNLQERVMKLVNNTSPINQSQVELSNEANEVIGLVKRELNIESNVTKTDIEILKEEVLLLKKDKAYLESYIKSIQVQQQEVSKHDYKVLFEESKVIVDNLKKKLRDKNKENNDLTDKIKEMVFDRKQLTATIRNKLSSLT